MKRTKRAKDIKGASSQADFRVCFPSKPHLTLTTKPICSPARPLDTSKRHHYLHSGSNNRGGQASPSLWAKTNFSSSDITEPTSPKVTCAGQIKVRTKKTATKNWESVMEGIEHLHDNNRAKAQLSFGVKKHFLQLFGCFTPLKGSTAISTGEEERETQVVMEGGVFSKWYMVLQENENCEFGKGDKEEECGEIGDCEGSILSIAPPSNALLLMRCRSTSTKTFSEKGKIQLDEDQLRRKESLALKCYDPGDLVKENSEIANEKWIVNGMKDPLSRSRRWRIDHNT